MAYNPGAGSGGQVVGSSGFNQNIESTGLSTTSVTVPYAGPYMVKGKFTIPTSISGAGQSSLVITVNQNGSPIYTGLAGAEGFYTTASCAANDIIAFVLSSSASVDAVNNSVKAVYSVSQGQ